MKKAIDRKELGQVSGGKLAMSNGYYWFSKGQWIESLDRQFYFVCKKEYMFVDNKEPILCDKMALKAGGDRTNADDYYVIATNITVSISEMNPDQ